MEVPIWEKSNLTLEEAAAYSNIGINKIREISNDESCRFVLWVGSSNGENLTHFYLDVFQSNHGNQKPDMICYISNICIWAPGRRTHG